MFESRFDVVSPARFDQYDGNDFNVYCDETCHLEHDGSKAMALGAIWVQKAKVPAINRRIREIKEKHGIKAESEVKWTKASPCNLALYLDLIDYFFDDDDLCFRVLVVPDKAELDHERYGQTHDRCPTPAGWPPRPPAAPPRWPTTRSWTSTPTSSRRTWTRTRKLPEHSDEVPDCSGSLPRALRGVFDAYERCASCDDEGDKCSGVYVWKARSARGRQRYKLLHEDERYLVVLEPRKGYCLLITAYYLDNDDSLRSCLREYGRNRGK